jgi:Flp pilus assembly CpaE family ATPase
VDLGRGISGLNSEVFQDMDEIFLVATCDVAALYRARETARWWRDRKPGCEHLSLILNRMGARPPISAAEVEKLLGIRVAATLPDAGSELMEAYQSGTLLPQSSALALKLEALAAGIHRRTRFTSSM